MAKEMRNLCVGIADTYVGMISVIAENPDGSVDLEFVPPRRERELAGPCRARIMLATATLSHGPILRQDVAMVVDPDHPGAPPIVVSALPSAIIAVCTR